MTPRHGLVIGKFYPPHAGHHLLVRTAAAVSEHVTVVVMAASIESIPLELRVAWMREVHALQPNVTIVGIVDDEPVDYGSDSVWNAHVALMLKAAGEVTSVPIDAVFTSEAYGHELGRRLHANHVLVDQARELVPISGTAVRSDPVGAWELLAPPVKGYFARRIVLVGAESTGKTTLAQALAQRLRERGGAHSSTQWVSEYGRELTVEKVAEQRAHAALRGEAPPRMEDLSWNTSDFVRVATEQNTREDLGARSGGPVLVCDTDAFATSIWHQRYVGERSSAVEALGRNNDLYLLTHPDDVPFTQDGIRDGERIRAGMTDAFVERLGETRRRWQWLRGASLDARVQHAVKAVDALLAEGWRLTPPLG